MKFVLCALFLATVAVCLVGAQQATPKALSKAEVILLLRGGAPSVRITELVKQRGIDFAPTTAVLDELRKAGADWQLIDVLRNASKPGFEKPLSDNEVLELLANHEPSETLAGRVQRAGIDFVPAEDYLETLRSKGATDALIASLRAAAPNPLTRDALLNLLAGEEDADRIAKQVQQRGIGFEPTPENLKAFRFAGATEPLLGIIRAARQFKVQRFGDIPPPPGSNIKRPVIIAVVPSDKAQGATPSGEDSETKVYTPQGYVTAPVLISSSEPSYTPEARKHSVEGLVEISIVVDWRGNVSDAKEVSKLLGDGLDEEALRAVKTWKFKPAMRNGSPVAVRITVQVEFKLHH